ncbi:DNA-directed RNA polymerase subunit alpha [Candidatus Gottesmanbacteria bacterium RIFCSPHIGHO2_01_FULL_42_12]|uniref:DNA-directed RNA polymerase subunit alpha n=1 Tax=Candidatus Gottesmanbacteria bacterium RIFCSPHIGHO2_01_FULL_42_12 TaxID=1798377 RepID=A0A1F5YZG1_9BACT|nr:MAG: DNA-directed RNA polymerase subunit alpha [Candidatus Gottesmanbacteria bacterium RIFCSPHIGHO2_01_FULL_42_12]
MTTDPNFKVKVNTDSQTYAKFVFEPLVQGYGHTLGNALRRVLLSSLSGAAVTSVKIDGVKHVFQALPGLKEDIVELSLNLKKLRLKLIDADRAVIKLEAGGPGDVTAAQIEESAEVEVVNKDLYLGNLADKKAKLSAELTVEKGLGYSLSDERKTDAVGVIVLDAAFSPVVRVNYTVETARVGRTANFDRLVLEVWTDGSLTPAEALKSASKILVSYFMQVFEPKADVFDVNVAVTPTISDDVLKMLIEELDLPVRLENTLKKGGIETVGQLLGTPRKDLLKIKNFGAKSFGIVEEKLREKGVAVNI